MKKILLIHNRYQNIGGEDIAVNNELKMLNNHYDVETIYFDNNITNPIFQVLNFLRNRNTESEKILRNKIDSFNPDIVYIHNTWFKASLGVFKVLKSYDVKVVLKIHNFRYFCTKSFLIKSHISTNSICSACGLDKSKYKFFNKYFEDSYIKSIIVNFYGKSYFKILKNFDMEIFVLTNFHKNFLENLTNKKNIHLFPNYLEINLNKATEKKNYIVYSGRISKEKGLEELVDSFLNSELNNLSLKILGNGPLLNYLRNKYPQSNIEFLGEVDNTKSLEIIKNSRAVVTATKLYEGQPTLLCEASLMSVPSVFPKTGGVGEFFPKNYELSFEQFNYDDLVNKLNLLRDEQFLKTIGENNNKFVSNVLSQENLMDTFEEVIHG